MSQSNTRYFNTYFYEDPYIETLTMEEAWLFITLMNNPHNNTAGIYEITSKRLSIYTKLPEDTVKAALHRLSNDGKIMFLNNWVSLKNFYKNNKLIPTMIYNSFQILKTVPKDMIVFVFADKNGQAEPWVNDWVIGLEKGFNQVAMSKYRALVKKNKKEDLPPPHEPGEIVFTLETLFKELLNTINPTLPPTLPPLYPPEYGEYKQEGKSKIEYESKKEIEYSTVPPFTGFKPAQSRNYTIEYDKLIKLWNSLNLPESRKFSINIPNWDDLISGMCNYSFDEINKAIENYSKIKDRDKAITYSTFTNFLIRGIEKYADSSMPFDNFKESEDEKNKRITAEAWDAEQAKSEVSK